MDRNIRKRASKEAVYNHFLWWYTKQFYFLCWMQMMHTMLHGKHQRLAKNTLETQITNDLLPAEGGLLVSLPILGSLAKWQTSCAPWSDGFPACRPHGAATHRA
jgi:hypothetical protein